MSDSTIVVVDSTRIEVPPATTKLVQEPEGVYSILEIETDRGTTTYRYYVSEVARSGVVMVGDSSGGLDDPAGGLYFKLAQDLTNHKINTLLVHYRHPVDLVESTIDAILGIRYLRDQKIPTIGLVGYSLGGVVTIQAAANDTGVRAIVTIATQAYGDELIAQISGEVAILMIHGDADTVTRPRSSEEAYLGAHEPKRLVIYEDVGHNFNEAAESLFVDVKAWLLKHLPGPVV